MLGWMCGKTHKDILRNEKISEDLEISPTEDKIKKTTNMVWSHYEEIIHSVNK